MPTPGVLAMLRDLHVNGADTPADLRALFGNETLERLLHSRHLATVPTPLGELVVLGPRGRRLLGLAPYYRSPPEAAASQLVRRRARATLERRGWAYRGRSGRTLLRFRDPDGQPALVLAQWREVRAASVRRVLAAHRAGLLAEGGFLLVWTRHPHRFARLERAEGGLLRTHYDTLPRP